MFKNQSQNDIINIKNINITLKDIDKCKDNAKKYYENIPRIPSELLHKHCYHDIDKVVINGVRHKYTWWEFVYNDEYNLSKDIVEDIMKNINEGRIYEIYKVLAMFIHAYNSIE